MELSVTDSGAGDDEELAALAGRAGHDMPGAFDELARRVRHRIQGWAHHVTGDPDEAEDVAQVVLLKLRSRSATYEGRSRFTTWLYRLTSNIAVDRARTARRRAALLAADANLESFATHDHVSADSSTDHLAQLAESYLGDLPARQREVFELVDLRGLPPAQVAERLGIAPATVRVTLLNARKAIRLKMLANHPHLLGEYRS